MSSKFQCVASAALLAAAWPVAMAQVQAPQAPTASMPAARLAPAAAVPVPRAASSSAFEGYKRFDDQPVGSWRDANDTVGRLGGWQAYAREAQGHGASADSASPLPIPAEHGTTGLRPGAGTVAPLMPAASSPGPSAAPAKKAPAGHSGHRMP